MSAIWLLPGFPLLKWSLIAEDLRYSSSPSLHAEDEYWKIYDNFIYWTRWLNQFDFKNMMQFLLKTVIRWPGWTFGETTHQEMFWGGLKTQRPCLPAKMSSKLFGRSSVIGQVAMASVCSSMLLWRSTEQEHAFLKARRNPFMTSSE